MIRELFDAFSPTPNSAARVRIGSRTYNREALEMAWLMLADDADRRDIRIRLYRETGLELAAVEDHIAAAAIWTGDVKAGSA